jgi:hypothetical protein
MLTCPSKKKLKRESDGGGRERALSKISTSGQKTRKGVHALPPPPSETTTVESGLPDPTKSEVAKFCQYIESRIIKNDPRIDRFD